MVLSNLSLTNPTEFEPTIPTNHSIYVRDFLDIGLTIRTRFINKMVIIIFIVVVIKIFKAFLTRMFFLQTLDTNFCKTLGALFLFYIMKIIHRCHTQRLRAPNDAGVHLKVRELE